MNFPLDSEVDVFAFASASSVKFQECQLPTEEFIVAKFDIYDTVDT